MSYSSNTRNPSNRSSDAALTDFVNQSSTASSDATVNTLVRRDESGKSGFVSVETSSIDSDGAALAIGTGAGAKTITVGKDLSDNIIVHAKIATNTIEADLVKTDALQSKTSTLNVGTASQVQTVNIGTGSGTTAINIGGVGDSVNIAGNLVTVNSSVLEVADPHIVLNKNGTAVTASDAGICVEIDGNSNAACLRMNNDRTKWIAMVPGGMATDIMNEASSTVATDANTLVKRDGSGYVNVTGVKSDLIMNTLNGAPIELYAQGVAGDMQMQFGNGLVEANIEGLNIFNNRAAATEITLNDSAFGGSVIRSETRAGSKITSGTDTELQLMPYGVNVASFGTAESKITVPLTLSSGLKITTGAGAAKVLVSDASGNATWQNNTLSGDVSGAASSTTVSSVGGKTAASVATAATRAEDGQVTKADNVNGWSTLSLRTDGSYYGGNLTNYHEQNACDLYLMNGRNGSDSNPRLAMRMRAEKRPGSLKNPANVNGEFQLSSGFPTSNAGPVEDVLYAGAVASGVTTSWLSKSAMIDNNVSIASVQLYDGGGSIDGFRTLGDKTILEYLALNKHEFYKTATGGVWDKLLTVSDTELNYKGFDIQPHTAYTLGNWHGPRRSDGHTITFRKINMQVSAIIPKLSPSLSNFESAMYKFWLPNDGTEVIPVNMRPSNNTLLPCIVSNNGIYNQAFVLISATGQLEIYLMNYPNAKWLAGETSGWVDSIHISWTAAS